MRAVSYESKCPTSICLHLTITMFGKVYQSWDQLCMMGKVGREEGRERVREEEGRKGGSGRKEEGGSGEGKKRREWR